MFFDTTSSSSLASQLFFTAAPGTANTGATTNPLLANSNAVTAIGSGSATTNDTKAALSRAARLNALVSDMSETISYLKKARTATRDVETLLKSLRSSLETTRTRYEDAKANEIFTSADDKSVSAIDDVQETDDAPAAPVVTKRAANTLAGTANVTEDTRLGDIAAFSGETRFGLTLGSGKRAETKIDADTTVGELADRLSGIVGVEAKVENGRFTITAENGDAFELRDSGSGILAGLGFTANQSRTITVERPAAIEADRAVAGDATLSSLLGDSNERTLSVRVGDTATDVTLEGDDTIEAVRARLDAVDGLNASLTEDGRLRLEGDDGQAVRLADGDGQVLEALGFTPSLTESTTEQVTVRADAETIGTNDIGSLWRLTSNSNIRTGDQFSIKVGDADPVVFTIQSSDTADSLVSRINADETLSGKLEASLTDDGALKLTAVGGGDIELDDVRGTALTGLGFAQDTAKVVTTAAPVTVGDANIRDKWRISSISGIENGDQFSIKVGDADAVTFTIESSNNAQALVDKINNSAELAGSVTASLTDDGALRLESTTGEGLELDDVRGTVLQGLGFAQDTVKVVESQAAITTGSTDIESLWRISSSSQIQNGDQFSIKLGDNDAVTFTIESNDNAQSLVDKINNAEGLNGAVRASISDDGALRLEATNGDSLELDDVRGTVLNGLGFVQDTVKTISTRNAVLTGSTDLDGLWRLSSSGQIQNGDQFSIRTGSNDAVTFTIESSDTAQSLVDKINNSAELAGSVTASLSDEGALRLEAVNGQDLELDSVYGTPLAGLGFAEETEKTISVDNAVATGSVDISDSWRLRYEAGINIGDSFSLKAGDGASATFTIDSSTTARSLVAAINADETLAGSVAASLTDDGQLRLEATTGEALTVQNITGDLLAGFGIASTGNAFSGYEDAEASGSVDLASLSRIIDLAGSQAGASFTVQVGDGTATEISVDNATTPQDLLDQLNAVQGLTASFNPDGTLALTAADAQAITLQNVSGSLLEDFGFSTTSLGGSNAVALGNDTLSLNTRFDAISRKKGDNQSLSLTKNGTTYNFNTGTDRTVGDLLAEIDAVEGITAELTEDGKVRIEATDGQSFQLNGNAWDLLGTRKGTYASEATTGLIANPTALYEGPAYAQIQAATHNETIRVASANAHPQNSYDTLVHRAEFGPVSETTYVHQANGGSTDELVYVHRAEEQSETVDVVTENDVVSAGAETQEITEDFVGLDEAEFISEASTGENSETNTNAAAASVHAADVARDGKVAAKRILDELTDKFAELSRNGIDLVRGRSRTASLDERGTSATVYGKDLTLDGLGLGDDFKLGSLDDIDALLDTVNSAIDDAATLKGEIDRKNGQITAHQGFAEMLSDSLESGEVAADATGSATDDDPLAKAKETGQMFLKLSQSLAGQLTDQLRVSGF